MAWLGDVLKHFELSKKFTVAVFVTTFSLLVGPALLPEKLTEVPEQWRWLVVGGCIFSGTLSTIWAVLPIWRLFLRIPSNLRNNPFISAPAPQENNFLLFLGEQFPNDSANLDCLRHDGASKLEVLEMCYNLQRKGFVRVNPYDDNLVSLTPNGRRYALKLIKAKA